MGKLFVKNKFYNKPKLELELLKNCNYNCHYCYAKAFKYKRKLEMDFNFLNNILKYLKKVSKNQKINLPNIILSGGEPLMYSKFKELSNSLNDFNVYLISNLFFIDKYIDILKKYNIIFSIHLDYIENYLNINFFNSLNKLLENLNNQKYFQWQFVLPDFQRLSIKQKELLIEFNFFYKDLFQQFKNSCFTHYQFILNHNKKSSKKFKVINFENIKQYEKILTNFPLKPFFFDSKENYEKMLKFYIENQFSFKNNYLCFNNNFLLTYDFNLLLECDDEQFLSNIKEKFTDIKLVLKPYKQICPVNYCDFQANSYCKKIKKDST